MEAASSPSAPRRKQQRGPEAESSRSTKLQRLDGFRRQLPFVTCSALSSILSLVEKEGIPEKHSRHDMKQAVKQAIARCTAYGVLVQQLPAKLPTGADLNIPCINLASLIQGMYAAGGYFYEMLNHVHEATPSSIGSPWRGVLYSDEVHPGNQLSSSGRKVWAVYFSFWSCHRSCSRTRIIGLH